jgi:hypothetical protein
MDNQPNINLDMNILRAKQKQTLVQYAGCRINSACASHSDLETNFHN